MRVRVCVCVCECNGAVASIVKWDNPNDGNCPKYNGPAPISVVLPVQTQKIPGWPAKEPLKKKLIIYVVHTQFVIEVS